MSKLVWAVVGVGLLVWTALAWIVNTLVDWVGAFASTNADILTPHAETVEWLSWLALFGSDVGSWIVTIVWALGVIFALILGFAGTRLFPQFGELVQKMRVQT